MTIISKLQRIQEILAAITNLEVSHYDYFGTSDSYCVWAEDQEQSSLEGDDFKVAQAVQGTIDYFTKTDMDAMIDTIQGALISNKISFYLNSVQYEDETELIHYEWVFAL